MMTTVSPQNISNSSHNRTSTCESKLSRRMSLREWRERSDRSDRKRMSLRNEGARRVML